MRTLNKYQHRTSGRFLFLVTACVLGGTGIVRADRMKAKAAEVNSQIDELAQYFTGKTIITDEVLYPADLPESLLIINNPGKPNEKLFWTKVIPNRPEIKVETVNNIIAQMMLNKSGSASLSLIGLSLDNKQTAEVIVEEVYRAKGAPITDPEMSKATLELVKKYAGDPTYQNSQFFYIQSMQFSTLKTRLYSETKGQFEGFGFRIGGKTFASNEYFKLRKMVSINIFPIRVTLPSPSVTAGNSDEITTAFSASFPQGYFQSILQIRNNKQFKYRLVHKVSQIKNQ